MEVSGQLHTEANVQYQRQDPVPSKYRGADKSLARPGRKQADICQNGVNFLRRLALQEKKLDDSARLDVVQMCDIVQGC